MAKRLGTVCWHAFCYSRFQLPVPEMQKEEPNGPIKFAVASNIAVGMRVIGQ